MDVDRTYLVDCILGNHMGMVSWIIFISLSRPVTIGQDEVEPTAFTILFVVFKANELIYCLRLKPLLKDLGFSLKLKQRSTVWIWANNM